MLKMPNYLASFTKRTFRDSDIDGDHSLDFDEFKALVVKAFKAFGMDIPDTEAIVGMFREHDWDGSKSLSQSQFQAAYKSLLLQVCPVSAPKSMLVPYERKEGRNVWQEYKKGARLGSGAFGTCWRAMSNKTADEVVVKKVQPLNGIGVMNEEFELLRELRHPFVMRPFDLFQEPDGTAYIVTEFAQHGDLFHYIKNMQSPVTE